LAPSIRPLVRSPQTSFGKWTPIAPHAVAERAERVVGRARAIQANTLLFSSGHFIRVLATRLLGLEPTANSRYFALSTASLSALGYERDLSGP
jgi:broad specificity phosphatase PhoE